MIMTSHYNFLIKELIEISLIETLIIVVLYDGWVISWMLQPDMNNN